MTAGTRVGGPASEPHDDPIAARERAIAIRARALSKIYEVYVRPADRLKQMLWRGRRTYFRAFEAVRSVDLDVHRGETVGIVGRNGSGKSTLLKMISGTLQPTSGELQVSGHVAPILTLGAGFNPEFTGRENVTVNAAILGLSDEQLRDRLEAIIAFADIGEFFDQPVKAYSSGMHARLAFAVAIHAAPEILVIDEILAVGDEAFNRKCFARMEELKASGSTILFASHSANMIVELCDRAILLENGERLLTSDPKTVISRYHRLLYSATPRFIREEIRALDRGEETGGEAGQAARQASAETNTQAGAHFDPKLVAESTVEYEQEGAQILDPRILTSDGRRVNVLQPDTEYVYAYEVDFFEPAFEVRFGMMIKLITGVELGGQTSHPLRGGMGVVDAGPARACAFASTHGSFRASTSSTRGCWAIGRTAARGTCTGSSTHSCSASRRRDPGSSRGASISRAERAR